MAYLGESMGRHVSCMLPLVEQAQNNVFFMFIVLKCFEEKVHHFNFFSPGSGEGELAIFFKGPNMI